MIGYRMCQSVGTEKTWEMCIEGFGLVPREGYYVSVSQTKV